MGGCTEVTGLLALMLLHHAPSPARTTAGGQLVPLAEQDRSRWDTGLVREGIALLQGALAQDRLGEYQAQAAIAALHADAQLAEETDWVQIREWYDELVRLTPSPVARLKRAVAVGEAEGPAAGLAAVAEVPEGVPRRIAVQAYLHTRAGDVRRGADLYARAAREATRTAERDHLTREAARLRSQLRPTGGGSGAGGPFARGVVETLSPDRRRMVTRIPPALPSVGRVRTTPSREKDP